METQRLLYRGYEIQITRTLVMWRAAIYRYNDLPAVDWTRKPIIAADAGIAEIQAQQRIDKVAATKYQWASLGTTTPIIRLS